MGGDDSGAISARFAGQSRLSRLVTGLLDLDGVQRIYAVFAVGLIVTLFIALVALMTISAAGAPPPGIPPVTPPVNAPPV